MKNKGSYKLPGALNQANTETKKENLLRFSF
jgi:hypothetical protein